METRQAAAAGYPLGVMVQPATGHFARHLAAYPSWAADNGCFARGARFDLAAYLAWLVAMPCRETCLFATAPDMVGDAAATWQRSEAVLPAVRALGYRAALVAQDGIEHLAIDWSAFDCLFIGGTTAWKLSETAYGLIGEAKRRGKWVHQGRCNSYRRLAAAAFAGCDSADGTFLKFAPDINVPRMLAWLDRMARQPQLAVPA